jgi:hypothetical protein
MYNIGVRIKEDMIKVGDLVRFKGSNMPHTQHTTVAGKVYLVLQIEHGLHSPATLAKEGRGPHVRVTGPTTAGVAIETLLYPAYRFEVV